MDELMSASSLAGAEMAMIDAGAPISECRADAWGSMLRTIDVRPLGHLV